MEMTVQHGMYTILHTIRFINVFLLGICLLCVIKEDSEQVRGLAWPSLNLCYFNPFNQ